MKQLEVQIMGQNYLLGCPAGGEARLLDAVERVDTAMCKIRDVGKVRARDRIAVLAALNLAFDLGDGAGLAHNGEARQSGDSDDEALARDNDDGLMLTSLLDRLDRALSEDGQLI